MEQRTDHEGSAPRMGEPTMGENPTMGDPRMGDPTMGENPTMEDPTMGDPRMGEPTMGDAPQEGEHESLGQRLEHFLHRHDGK